MAELKDEEIAAMMASIESEDEPKTVSSVIPEKKEIAPLNRFIEMAALKKDVEINPSDLDSAMMNHVSMYVHYASQTVFARRQFDRLKNAFEILEARLDSEVRENWPATRKLTEAGVKAAITGDSRWSSGQSRVIEANSIWRLCEVAENAFLQRKDLILEIARDRRKEKEGQLRVLDGQNVRDQVATMLKDAKTA